MKPNISEFSYGFAITNELVQAPGMNVSAAPVFPSLIAEGQPGGGWDVRVEQPGVPLFLQFKLSDYMTRRNCREARDANFNVPCYRMHIRRPPSRQHEMLLDLEQTGADVYYVAPAFHEPEELNEAFMNRLVRSRSIWVRPSQIGPLPDDREHHVSFEQVGAWAFFSEPRRLDGPREFEQVAAHLERALKSRGSNPLRLELATLAEKLMVIAEKRRDIRWLQQAETREVFAERPPLEQIAHYASIFLECQFFVVQSRPVASV